MIELWLCGWTIAGVGRVGRALFDYLVCLQKERLRDRQAQLMTNSNFVGRSTGRSAGLAALRIVSMRVAAHLS